jgi:uncharacterized protein Veg
MKPHKRRGDNMAEKSELHMIKANIENLVGKNVIITANKGRKKATVREGLLEEAYTNVFVVKLKNEFNTSRKISFNYTDILTKTVELQENEKII